MHDKKNLLKLLPAAAVIAAVAVTAVQGKATDGIQKEPENTEVRDAGELSGLLKTAYFDDDTSADSGTTDVAKVKKKKAKKSGIKKGTAKALPDESKKRPQKVREAQPPLSQMSQKMDIRMVLIREAEPALAVQSQYRLQFPGERSQQ